VHYYTCHRVASFSNIAPTANTYKSVQISTTKICCTEYHQRALEILIEVKKCTKVSVKAYLWSTNSELATFEVFCPGFSHFKVNKASSKW
jgi:hypothetical protein